MDSVDLRKLETIFERAEAVVPHIEQRKGLPPGDFVVLRHDVDNKGWPSTFAMAEWEARHGWRSTFYFLHTAPYWGPQIAGPIREIKAMGHEIGFHNNALAEGVRTKSDPFVILDRAVTELREWADDDVVATAAHGDPLCQFGGFINYMLFSECQSKYVQTYYAPVEELGFAPRPLGDFGFEYAGDWLPRPVYMTDSGGAWVEAPGTVTIDEAVKGFPFGALFSILQHPDWWPRKLYA